MANPQPDKFTRISNELMEELIRTNLSGQELRAVLFVIRKTYGFNKKADFIPLSQFAKALLISKDRAYQVVKKLRKKKILTIEENLYGIGIKYSFNKDYEQWERVEKNLYRREKPLQPSRKTSTEVSRKTSTSKDNTKDNIQKTWEAYKKIFKDYFKREPTLTTKRESHIKARLKNFSVDDLIIVFQKIRESEWHIGKNPKGTFYATPEYCFRNDEQTENWLNKNGRKEEKSPGKDYSGMSPEEMQKALEGG